MDYWSRPDEDLSEAEILGGLHGLKLLSAPGVEERYSNLGAALLGIVISRVSGVSYSKYISDNLLAPLKMSRSAWSFQGASKHGMARGYLRDKDGKWREGHHWRLGAGSAMGGLYAPLKDMARYLIFQLDAWPPRSSPDNGPLKRSTVRESQLVLGFGHPGHVLYGAAWGVGSTGVDRDLVISHAGSTHIYSSVVRILPERGLAVVLLANASNSRALIAVAKKMTERVMNALARGGLSLPLRQPSQEEDHQFKRR
jgi:CubicO group peptidase (beta-lactamase class C family)